ncbi:MAG: hypothetical protein M1355_01105 [Patescibacteria group bacterium]|nr:hypothetical protein [Patescibacteria group bacterium]
MEKSAEKIAKASSWELPEDNKFSKNKRRVFKVAEVGILEFIKEESSRLKRGVTAEEVAAKRGSRSFGLLYLLKERGYIVLKNNRYNLTEAGQIELTLNKRVFDREFSARLGTYSQNVEGTLDVPFDLAKALCLSPLSFEVFLHITDQFKKGEEVSRSVLAAKFGRTSLHRGAPYEILVKEGFLIEIGGKGNSLTIYQVGFPPKRPIVEQKNRSTGIKYTGRFWIPRQGLVVIDL